MNDFRSGIYNLKIEDQVCHISPNTIKTANDIAHCSQIYIYDDFQATEIRLLRTFQN